MVVLVARIGLEWGMSKSKKHHFTHQDPEKIVDSPKGKKDNKSLTVANASDFLVGHDLRRVLLTIGITIALVIALYLLNQRVDLILKLKSLY